MMNIERELQRIIPPGRIRMRYIDLVSYGADAGFYFLLPKAVVKPVSEEEIIRLFSFSRQCKIPLVFRTGGTSLSGQSITDGILVDLSQHWNRITIEEHGNSVRVQPGITGGMVNAHLKSKRRKIGPDPSSINAAMMGGIISNNASGMCCGVKLNSYHTTKYLRFILPDGKTYTTEHEGDYKRFECEHNEVFHELSAIRDEIFSSPALLNLIRKKYASKNTVGYALNAFIDYRHPLDILAKLLIGAEGTLAFIAEAVMQTVPDYAFKSTALLYFPDIYAACQSIGPLNNAGARAVELMDRASLFAVESVEGMPGSVKTLPVTAAALLVEFQENTRESLLEKTNQFLSSAGELSLLSDPVFTIDEEEQALLWKVRKGLFPAVGAVRASGTTVILEDVGFPVEKLGDAIVDLQKLFEEFNYTKAIIFGHAKDGNIHFVITQSFEDVSEITRYNCFMTAVVELVVKKYDGTLKAEHGTGRNMAPFVETEWGEEAYRIMKRLKKCIDPHNLLNPGVIINEDRNVHVSNLKSMPAVEAEADKCTECGFCEPRCPSRDITATPRRRIVIRRELERLKLKGNSNARKLLLKQYTYDGLQTCAVDGLCATACPVDINTGDLVKRLRRENHSMINNKLALAAAKNFRAVEFAVAAGVNIGNNLNRIFGKYAMTKLTSALRTIIPLLPQWSTQLQCVPGLPVSGVINNAGLTVETHVVYFPACISRLMGKGVEGKKSIMQVFVNVAAKVGITAIIPPNIKGSCCGQIFSSKGFNAAYEYTANDIVEKLWVSSMNGRIAVITDVSSCAYTLRQIRPALSEANKVKYDSMKIMDSVEFLHDELLPRVKNVNRKDSIVLHPVCSLQKTGTQKKFIALAEAFATKVTVPLNAGCCGMAGDRGFLFPELTASSTLHEAAEVRKEQFEGYYSSTKTCEMAMTAAVGRNYESILYLVDEGLA